MAITAALVKELRERTGAGMMECKKALVEANGDIEAAIEQMRKSGQAKAAKKAGRATAEGIILTKRSDDGARAIMVEVNCETDFVGKDDNFKAFADKVAVSALASGEESVEKLSAQPLEPTSDQTVEDARLALVQKIGENIQVRRALVIDGEGSQLAGYVHGGRIGVLVKFSGADEALGRDIAMHIAASSPEVVKPEDVSEDRINKETEIFKAQALQEGKPVEIVEKMVTGRIKKLLKEVSLYGQEFVKDPDLTVEKLLKQNSAEVHQFWRFELGEGVEKKQDNFAEEVMAQVRGE